MESAQSTGPRSDFEMTPFLRLYADAIESWKETYEKLAESYERAIEGSKARGDGDSPLVWQKNGEEFFMRFIEAQIELCRFYEKRWEQYLKLPSQLAHCRTLADWGHLQSSFLSQMAADYASEGQQLARQWNPKQH